MTTLTGATTVARRIVDLVLLALIVVVLIAVALGRGAPLIGRQSIVIAGGSMEPAVPLGSAIVIAPVDAASLVVGDVVSMHIGEPHATYTHRIVAVVDRADGRWIRTKGDANADADPTLVPASAVIGRVELTVPFMGYLLTLLSLPVGVLFVLGLAATLFAVAWLLESLEPEIVVRTAAGDGSATPRGEPIAARSARIALPATPLATALASPTGSPVAAGPVRPTIHEQIDRIQGVRRRRAAWRPGRTDRTGRG